jgi:YfiH family protein
VIRSALALRRVRHAHSERADGAVGNSSVAGHLAARARLAEAVGGPGAGVVVPHQTHGARVALVGPEDAGRVLAATDGLATAAPGVVLLVQGADCPLVLLASDATPAVAVVHSGWRGTVLRIAAEGVRALASLGASPGSVAAAIFPGIGPCCFEVGPDVVGSFRSTFGAAAEPWTRAGTGDRSHLDLAAAIRATLTDAGVDPVRIDTLPGCTVCDGRFFSHRGSRGAPERHGLAAAIVPDARSTSLPAPPGPAGRGGGAPAPPG